MAFLKIFKLPAYIFIENLQKTCNFFARLFVKPLDWFTFYKSEEMHFEEIDENAIALLAKKDPEAFTIIFEKFFDKIYRFFVFRLQDEDEAYDLTSDTFERLINKIHKYKDKSVPFSAWVFKIANNILIDHIRKHKKEYQKSDADLTQEKMEKISQDFDFSSIDQKIISEILWQEVNNLPDRQKEIWSFKLADDLSHGEIAEILDISVQNVNVIVHRSFIKLKKTLTYHVKRHFQA